MSAFSRLVAVPTATLLAVLAALTSWQGFTVDPGRFLAPALLIGAIVVGSGLLCRGIGLPRSASALLQTLVGTALTLWVIAGSPFPTPGTLDRLGTRFDRASHTVMTARPPVEVADGIGPYLVLGSFACLLLADLIAGTLRRPALVGLVLLGVVAVPISVPDGRLAWWSFVLAAAGYLLVLTAAERDRVAQWGSPLEPAPAAGFGGARAVPVGAPLIGAGATVVALMVPVIVPTLDLDLLGGGHGDGGGDRIQVTNPSVGMYDDLKKQSLVPLVEVRSEDPTAPAPHYLRIAALTVFNGREWTPGRRKLASENTARTRFAPPFHDPRLIDEPHTYTLHALTRFDSAWLPTFVHTTRISAEGAWRYDPATLDFLATEDGLSTAGLTWSDTAAEMDPPKEKLIAASTTGADLPPVFEQLPDQMPDRIGEIAREHTSAYSQPYLKAVALQRWLRGSDFAYSLDRPNGTSARDLLHFLTTDRRGYCQQFATAMAAMARTLGIPARVAVGFLNADKTYGKRYVFRAKNLHAWTELWFDDIGWVRFDPTPSAAGTTPPAYTQGVLADEPSGPNGRGPEITQPLDPAQPAPQARSKQVQKRPDMSLDGGTPTGPKKESHAVPIITGTLLVLAGIVLALPALLRRRRRAARRHGGPEECWDELRDTALDLGLGWSDDLSPRAAGRELGAGIDDVEALRALDRIVRAVERERYARIPAVADAALHEDVATVRGALLAHASRGSVRRAQTWPRSVLRRRGPAGRQPVVEVVDRDLVDHTS